MAFNFEHFNPKLVGPIAFGLDYAKVGAHDRENSSVPGGLKIRERRRPACHNPF